VLAGAAACAACTLTGSLNAVGPIEDDRRHARFTHARKAAHVHDEVTVAKEGAALGDGYWGLGDPSLRSRQAGD
jgi:hypothetical protein